MLSSSAIQLRVNAAGRSGRWRAAEWGRGAEQEVEARRGVFMLKGQFEVFSLLNLELNDYVQFLCVQEVPVRQSIYLDLIF